MLPLLSYSYFICVSVAAGLHGRSFSRLRGHDLVHRRHSLGCDLVCRLALDLSLGPRLRALPVNAAVTLSSVDAASAATLSSADVALALALPSALPLASSVEMAPGLDLVRRPRRPTRP